MTIREWMRGVQKHVPHIERFELEVLLSARLDMGRASLLAHLDDAIPDALMTQLEQDEAALAQHTPLQYVMGQAYFRDAAFYVNENVLIPRFDTEYLVEAVLERVKKPQAVALDLCTGSGIIAISLKRAHPDWQVSASDLSDKALEVAKINGARLEAAVEWKQGDLFAPWAACTFDIIASNPPYISETEYKDLAPEIHKEPLMALVGDNEGLQFYERLTTEAAHYLKPGGWLCVEIGWQQGPAVVAMFNENNFKEVSCLTDGQGHDRVVDGQLA